eukprot:TRINITY_DN3989_c0_g1_i1.p2 TRINITY_DN3989_c0_g1~~TRINITY_DN3989_c0_g1_i1.p2  ORF type:complete len:283 (+),score=40.60 TRINITY_DN3989_c0_g1_i1:118-849(+)
MTQHMHTLILYISKAKREGKGSAITHEEQNLLSVAYKNRISSRRVAWKRLALIEKDEPDRSKVESVRKYRDNVRKEIESVCLEVFDLLSNHIFPYCFDATEPESKIFFYKMQGDYKRYYYELQSKKSTKRAAMADAQSAYETAMEVGRGAREEKTLYGCNCIFLGAALNYSIFLYEILHDLPKAVRVAKTVLDNAVEDLEQNEALLAKLYGSESSSENALILQLLRENIKLWNIENKRAKSSS